jgi:hypothetical protein
MAKSPRVTHKGTGVWMDDVAIHRVQTFGASTSFNNEDISELGDINVIEVVDDVPSVDVTLDTNEYGGLRALAV